VGDAGLPQALAADAPGFTSDERRALARALVFQRDHRVTSAAELAEAFV
jgi:hypothetical protein